MVKSSFQRLPDKTSFHHHQLCSDEKQSKAERKKEEKRTKRMEKEYRRRKNKRARCEIKKCRRLFSEEEKADPPRLQSTGGQLSRAPKLQYTISVEFAAVGTKISFWTEQGEWSGSKGKNEWRRKKQGSGSKQGEKGQDRMLWLERRRRRIEELEARRKRARRNGLARKEKKKNRRTRSKEKKGKTEWSGSKDEEEWRRKKHGSKQVSQTIYKHWKTTYKSVKNKKFGSTIAFVRAWKNIAERGGRSKREKEGGGRNKEGGENKEKKDLASFLGEKDEKGYPEEGGGRSKAGGDNKEKKLLWEKKMKKETDEKD
nr:MAG: wsv427-like protein [Sesarmops intermedium nimavirus]